MNELLPRLFLSNAEDAYNPRMLRACRITHVINCTEELPSDYPEPVHATKLNLNDEDDPLAKSVLECAARLIEDWLKSGYTILVHCKAAVSRSPATIMAYLIMYKGHTYDSAYDYVSSRHGFIWPNPQYIAALKALRSN